MARPAYRDAQPTAKTRLKEAFWKLLSETNYSHITVKRLTGLAQVNPNTFYYHYTTMDDLALVALDDEKLYEIPIAIRAKILSKSDISLSKMLEYIRIDERWEKIRLFITSDSTILHQHFYDTMERFWLSLIGVQKEQLSENDYQDLSFILHGTMATISMQAEEYSIEYIQQFTNRALGQGVIQTIENLIMKYQI